MIKYTYIEVESLLGKGRTVVTNVRCWSGSARSGPRLGVCCLPAALDEFGSERSNIRLGNLIGTVRGVV